MIKIWLFKKFDMQIFYTEKCTQKYVEENYSLIAVTDTELEDWFNNFKLNGQFYDTHARTAYKDTGYKTINIFAAPYRTKPLKELKQNPQIENMNNPICPVCGYVDYYGWESPEGDYKCPQCKSLLNLEHRYEMNFDGYGCSYHRTIFKKLHYPKKIFHKPELLKEKENV